MSDVVAVAIATDLGFPPGSEVTHVDYGLHRLSVLVEWTKQRRAARVEFEHIDGIRVADEANFTGLASSCYMGRGWIFEVQKGGWLSETGESYFLSRMPDSREYIIIGCDDCVNVIARTIPVVSEVPYEVRS